MGNRVSDSVTKRDAVFSEDFVHRYLLTREWGYGYGTLAVIGLNPSVADHQIDDPTIRREIVFGQRWGFARLFKLNIFAFRSTDPVKLYKHPDPIGRQNDDYILEHALGADLVVCAWGLHGEFMRRGQAVRKLLESRILHVLGLTKDGHPKHPLYLPGNVEPEVWR